MGLPPSRLPRRRAQLGVRNIVSQPQSAADPEQGVLTRHPAHFHRPGQTLTTHGADLASAERARQVEWAQRPTGYAKPPNTAPAACSHAGDPRTIGSK